MYLMLQFQNSWLLDRKTHITWRFYNALLILWGRTFTFQLKLKDFNFLPKIVDDLMHI